MLIKTNKALKTKAKKLAKEMGLPLGTVVNNYLKNFVADKRVTLKVPSIPNEKTSRIIEQARKDYKAGKFHGPFKTTKEMTKHLKS